jgi:hypothetical protein
VRWVVWTAEGGRTHHYNAALQVSELPDGLTSVVWTEGLTSGQIRRHPICQ